MLKDRLKEVGQLVTEDSLIDIGTDHGYLIIDLLNNHKISKAMAVEITKGPLTNVETNVKNHRLTKAVECFLSDGLTKVPSEVTDNYQAISICGMGGALIAKILTDSKQKIAGKTLYLQPNNGEQILRQTLVDLGFKITVEMVVVDNDIFYEIIKAEPGCEELDKKQLYFGPRNLQLMSTTFLNKHKQQHEHLMKVYKQLTENNKKNQKINDEIKLLEEVIHEAIETN